MILPYQKSLSSVSRIPRPRLSSGRPPDWRCFGGCCSDHIRRFHHYCHHVFAVGSFFWCTLLCLVAGNSPSNLTSVFGFLLFILKIWWWFFSWIQHLVQSAELKVLIILRWLPYPKSAPIIRWSDSTATISATIFHRDVPPISLGLSRQKYENNVGWKFLFSHTFLFHSFFKKILPPTAPPHLKISSK